MSIEKTFFDKFEIKGQWWIPEASENKIFGILKFDNGNIKLELLGILGNQTYGTINGFYNPSLIWGLTEEGRPITLYQGHTVHLSHNSGGTHNSTLSPRGIFFEKHISSIPEYSFNKIYVHFTHLEEWTGIYPFRRMTKFKAGKPVGFEIEMEGNELFKINMPSINSVITLFQNFSGKEDHVSKVTLNYEVNLEIYSEEPQNFDWFWSVIFKFRNLFSLLIGEPVFYKQIIILSDEVDQSDTSIFTNAIFTQRRSKTREINPHEVFIPLNKIIDSIGQVFDTFFSNYELLQPVYELFLGLLYHSTTHPQFQFLNLMQAVETFHRRKLDGEYLEPDLYKKIRVKLLESYKQAFREVRDGLLESSQLEGIKVTEKIDSLQELNNIFNSRLGFGNQFTLKTRLKQLFSNLSTDEIALITNDVNGFINGIAKTRDYLTHFHKEGKNGTLEGADLLNAIASLRTLIILLLLKELNFEEPLCIELIKNSIKFRLNPYKEIEYE